MPRKRYKRPDLTAEKVRALLFYNEYDGALYWLVDGEGHKAGERAGRQHKNGYRAICLEHWPFWEHRIIWLWMTGAWPPHTIDHRNRNKADNRWDNLRAATKGQQQWNRVSKGVYLRKERGTWRAQFQHERKRYYVGAYPTAEEASAAYHNAVRKARGEFYAEK